MIKETANYVRHACLETVRRPGIAYEDRMVGTAAVRGVCPEYGDMRNEQPSEGRWINSLDELERRRVVFLGARVREQLFGGRPAVGETVLIAGVRFTVIGTMDRKIQLSNYFSSDDESTWIPYSAANDLWNAKYADVLVFEPIAPQFEQRAEAQVLAAIATRQQFSPTDKKAIQMFGREEFRPVINGITIGLQVLLMFIGILTLGIGGVGVMNIMLVSVDERIREIGLRRALGARKWHIKAQFLAETLLIMLLGGAIGIVVSYLVAAGRRNASADGPAVRRRLRQSRHPPQNFILHRHDFNAGVAGRRRAERADSRVTSGEPRSRRGPALRVMSGAVPAFKAASHELRAASNQLACSSSPSSKPWPLLALTPQLSPRYLDGVSAR